MSLAAINEVQLIPIDLGDISEHPQWPHSLSPHERLDFAELGVDKATTDVMLEVEDLSRHYTAFESYSSSRGSYRCDKSLLLRATTLAPNSASVRQQAFGVLHCRMLSICGCTPQFHPFERLLSRPYAYDQHTNPQAQSIPDMDPPTR